VIVAAGLSPAWQHVLHFEQMQWGRVNRATRATWCAAGKVINVGIALRRLNAVSRSVVLVGGEAGSAVRRDVAAQGADARWVESAVPTRVCTTLLEAQGHVTTELVENAGRVSAAELQAFTEAFVVETASADLVIFAGSLPAAAPSTFCRDLIARCDGRVILDIRGDDLLEALNERPFLVKPNRSELSETLGLTIRDESELIDAMRKLNTRGAEWVVVTHGDQGVFVTSATDVYRIDPPSVPVTCPIGCGDCMAAGLASALQQGRDVIDSIRFGVAVAVSKLADPLPSRVDSALATQLEKKVTSAPL